MTTPQDTEPTQSAPKLETIAVLLVDGSEAARRLASLLEDVAVAHGHMLAVVGASTEQIENISGSSVREGVRPTPATGFLPVHLFVRSP